MLYKVFGSALVVASSAWIAFRINAEEDRKLQRIESYIELMNFIMNSIDCFCIPVGDILHDADSELLLRCGYEKKEKPRSAEDMLFGGDAFGDEELLQIMQRFWSSVGRSYRNEEVARCRMAIEELKALFSKRRDERTKKKRTVPALCICSALGIVIAFF